MSLNFQINKTVVTTTTTSSAITAITTTPVTTTTTTSSQSNKISERKSRDEVQPSSKTVFAESQDYYSIDPSQFLIPLSNEPRELTAIEKVDRTWRKVMNSL